MNPEANPWTTLAAREIYDNPWIRVTEHDVLNPAGRPGIYGVVKFKNRAIGIIPVDDEGYTWLVGQYRFPLGAYSWEIPEGGGPLDEDPLTAARRELAEETGLTAARWELLLEMHLSNSVSDEHALIYLARDLTPGPADPDETEQLTVRRLPLDEAVEMVLRGEITDAMSVAGLLRLRVM